MRILHILAPARFGGLESVVQTLGSAQAAAGHEVHIAAIMDEGAAADHPFLEALRNEPISLHQLEVGPRRYRRERQLVREACAVLSPDVAHTHGYRVDVLQSDVVRGLGLPHVTSVHGFTGGDLKNRFYERLQLRSFRRANAVVAVSRPLEERLLSAGISRDRLYCIPNAWRASGLPHPAADARERLGVPIGVFHVAFIGRLGREKGADLFVEALAAVPDIPLAASIIGTGRERDDLERRARDLRLEGRVHWQGFVPDAARWLGGCDLVVLSSRTEGTPIVLLEAMALGVPVIATRVGGIPDVLSEREGILVDPERPELLAEAIREVFVNPTEAAERARLARERIQRDLDPGEWSARYVDVYKRVLAGT